MFGAIVPDKGELKVKEFNQYRSVYCGVCKALSRRYGFIAQNVLNYDCTFLALLIHALSESALHMGQQRCIAAPFKRHDIALPCLPLDMAADMNVLLAAYKLHDDWRDDRRVLSLGLYGLLSGARRKAVRQNTQLFQAIDKGIAHLDVLEKQRADNMDAVSDAFASMLAECFYIAGRDLKEPVREALRHIGYNVGKWVYLLDAFEDMQPDAEKGRYNVLLYQFSGINKEEQVRDAVRFNMQCALNQAGQAYQLLPLRHSKAILDNIFEQGLWQRMERAFSRKGTGKEKTKQHESI